MSTHPPQKRLGLAREPGDALFKVVASSGWLPITLQVTAMRATGLPVPLALPDAVILLSPAGAQQATLPEGVPVLVTGEGTARALPGHSVWIPEQPSAEGLWALLQARFPGGGEFLLVRGERSRGYLEAAAGGTAWHLHPWITHAERPLEPLPRLPDLEAVLALSPLQAEVLGPLAANLLRFAWGERSAQAFAAVGHPAQATCGPKSEALERMLRAH